MFSVTHIVSYTQAHVCYQAQQHTIITMHSQAIMLYMYKFRLGLDLFTAIVLFNTDGMGVNINIAIF